MDSPARLSADPYDPQFVQGLFDSMSKTYGLTNYLTSFGFTARWRRQCVAALPALPPSPYGFDLMSGMGECWGHLLDRLQGKGHIVGIDISEAMNEKALAQKTRLRVENIEIRSLDVLQNDLLDGCADFVVSTFGLKTFSPAQRRQLAAEVGRLLKPGGAFSFIEISDPKGWFLRPLYLFYLKTLIPFIGRLFLGNPSDYRMLGIYCERFGDCTDFHEALCHAGLEAHFQTYFFGCATGVFGNKPLLPLEG